MQVQIECFNVKYEKKRRRTTRHDGKPLQYLLGVSPLLYPAKGTILPDTASDDFKAEVERAQNARSSYD